MYGGGVRLALVASNITFVVNVCVRVQPVLHHHIIVLKHVGRFTTVPSA